MAGWREIQKQKVSEAHAGTEDISSSATGLRRLRQFPKATKNLLFNPTFMFISLAGAAESVWNIILIGDTLHDMTGCNSSYATCSYMYFITISGVLVSGVATFLPKYLESQFSLKSSIAAIYIGMKLSCRRQLCIGWSKYSTWRTYVRMLLTRVVGAITVPAGCGGMFFGGFIVKHFDLKVRGMLKFITGLSVAMVALAFVFFVRCENVDFAGISVTYDGAEMTR